MLGWLIIIGIIVWLVIGPAYGDGGMYFCKYCNRKVRPVHKKMGCLAYLLCAPLAMIFKHNSKQCSICGGNLSRFTR
jgi:hypothetical protein